MNDLPFAYFNSLDKLKKTGESAWKSTKDAAASVASKTEKMTNTLADKTTSAVVGAAETTKQTTASIIDNSSKLAKDAADKTSSSLFRAWDGSKDAAAKAAEQSKNAAGQAWEGINCNVNLQIDYYFRFHFEWNVHSGDHGMFMYCRHNLANSQN